MSSSKIPDKFPKVSKSNKSVNSTKISSSTSQKKEKKEPEMASNSILSMKTPISTTDEIDEIYSGEFSKSVLSGVDSILESDLYDNSSHSGTLIENDDKSITVKSAIKKTSDELGLLEADYLGEIKDKYDQIPIEYVIQKFKLLYNKWFGEETEYRERTVYELMDLGLTNFGLKNKRITHELLSTLSKQSLFETLKLMQWFKKENIFYDKYPENDIAFSVLFNRIFEIIYYSEKCIADMLRIQIAMNPDYDSTMNDDPSIFRFEGYDLKTNSAFQTLVLYLLRELHENQYRRYNGSLYKMRFIENENKEKIFTYSWKEECKIKNFVYQATCKETNYHQWKNATSAKSNLSEAIRYLEDCFSEEFPELIKDRHVFSFRNGVYITNEKDKQTGKFTDYFYNYKSKTIMSSKVVAAKFFDLDFNNYDGYSLSDWFKIPTPNFDKILLYQFKDNKECDDIIKWMFILIGKLMYNVREMEGWQIMPYLMGMAGAGKSTICEIAKLLYEPSDIGILENTIEEKFGLAPISGKYIVLAPEIKKSFSLDQALFQKIISGEECALPQKNKNPLQLVWNTPMFMASNEPPGFADAAGSISRRLVVFKFLKIVRANDSDPQLMSKLEKEMAHIIKKANMAYLDTVNNFSKKDIWSILPEYFKITRDMLGEETNTLKHFLGSGIFEIGKDLYCAEKDFKERYKQYCLENGLGKATWTATIYEGPLAEISNRSGIEIILEKGGMRKYPKEIGKKRRMNYILGLDFKEKENQEQTPGFFEEENEI